MKHSPTVKQMEKEKEISQSELRCVKLLCKYKMKWGKKERKGRRESLSLVESGGNRKIKAVSQKLTFDAREAKGWKCIHQSIVKERKGRKGRKIYDWARGGNRK